MDAPGSMAKFSLAKPGAPLGCHVDQYHEAFNRARGEYRDLHGEYTRRSVAWLLCEPPRPHLARNTPLISPHRLHCLAHAA